MQESSSVVIQPLDDELLGDVVRIHQSVLGYTFNSQLGDEHLAFMYRQLSCDAKGYTGVALVSGQPVGIISGSTDMDATKSMLMKSLTAALWLNMLACVLRNPALGLGLWNNTLIDRPVFIDGKRVAAILTTVAVSPGFHGLGIGRHLVGALEIFLMDQGIQRYCVNTLINNIRAREFYKKLGFEEAGSRADSVILIKEILKPPFRQEKSPK